MKVCLKLKYPVSTTLTDHPRRAQEAGGRGRRLAPERGDHRAGQQEEPLCRHVPPQQGERSCRCLSLDLHNRVSTF